MRRKGGGRTIDVIHADSLQDLCFDLEHQGISSAHVTREERTRTTCPIRALAMTGIETASIISLIICGSDYGANGEEKR